ncbi:MAG: hypothetical protein IJI06_02095 [Oscillospiraceae bacterium]|nr:hypothetical protein [Oscillospiraceae bacterium]
MKPLSSANWADTHRRQDDFGKEMNKKRKNRKIMNEILSEKQKQKNEKERSNNLGTEKTVSKW